MVVSRNFLEAEQKWLYDLPIDDYVKKYEKDPFYCCGCGRRIAYDEDYQIVDNEAFCEECSERMLEKCEEAA